MNKYIRKHITLAFARSSLIFLYMFLLVLPVQKARAVTCHCFKERAFKPSQPASADPYILATARNSLLAAAAGIDKGTVVRKRMTGTTETDLWLSDYLSTRVGNRSADQFLEAKDKASSWAGALDAMNLDTGTLGEAFNGARKDGDADAMARALAGQVLGKTFNAGESTLDRLHQNGANIAETAVSLYIARLLNRTPESVLGEVRDNNKTWGELLHAQGIKIDTVGDLIAEAVKKNM